MFDSKVSLLGLSLLVAKKKTCFSPPCNLSFSLAINSDKPNRETLESNIKPYKKPQNQIRNNRTRSETTEPD
jgi:hypothetical protein